MTEQVTLRLVLMLRPCDSTALGNYGLEESRQSKSGDLDWTPSSAITYSLTVGKACDKTGSTFLKWNEGRSGMKRRVLCFSLLFFFFSWSAVSQTMLMNPSVKGKMGKRPRQKLWTSFCFRPGQHHLQPFCVLAM